MSNPAARLHAILQKAINHTDAGNSSTNAWRFILGLPQASTLDLMTQVSHLYQLPRAIENDIRRFSDLDPELYLGWIPEVEKALQNISLTGGFNTFKSSLTNSLLISLRFCSHELEKRLPEKEISQEEIQTIRDATASLYDQVLASDLPPNLFRYFLDHLMLLLNALDSYTIAGAMPIQHAVDAVIGSAITEPKTATEARDSKFGEQFWHNVVGKAATALKLGKTALELVDAARKLLPPPNGGGLC